MRLDTPSLLAMLLLAGCVSNPFKPEPTYVEVPVSVSCVTWEPVRDPDSFGKLSVSAALWEQVKALLVDREHDRRYIEGQHSVIEGCR